MTNSTALEIIISYKYAVAVGETIVAKYGSRSQEAYDALTDLLAAEREMQLAGLDVYPTFVYGANVWD